MKIAFVSQPEYFRFMYENDLDVLGSVKEFRYNFSMTEKDFFPLVEYDPDLCFFFRGEFFPDEVLRKLKGTKVNLSSEPFPNYIGNRLNYSLDSLKRYRNFRKIVNKSFDYVFHYDRSSLTFMEEDGIHLSGEFYFPVATGVYKKRNLEKKWDFIFIGRSTTHRERFLTPLKHHYRFLHVCHGMWGDELVDYVNQSSITLNIHAENEISWEPRVQMLMATGNLVISEKITPNPYLIPGTDFIEIASPRELLEASEYYLQHDAEREAIARRGMEKIQLLFDARKQFGDFVADILDGTYSTFSSSRPRMLTNRLYIMALVKSIRMQAREVLRELV
jgi:hypothetical protein